PHIAYHHRGELQLLQPISVWVPRLVYLSADDDGAIRTWVEEYFDTAECTRSDASGLRAGICGRGDVYPDRRSTGEAGLRPQLAAERRSVVPDCQSRHQRGGQPAD